jgi:hypothetical protein
MSLLIRRQVKVSICKHKIYTIFNSNLNNMAKKFRKRRGRVDKCLFGCRFVTMETKHIDENKVNLEFGNVPIGP